MICIVTQHFNLNRICLMLIGLWPYECSKLVRFQTFFCFTILISSVVYQLAVFISEDCTINLILKVFSIALLFFMYVIEYNSFRINRQIIKWSLDQLQHICDELKDEKEIDIMKKCGDDTRRYTILLIRKRIYIIYKINFYSYRIEKAIAINMLKNSSLENEFMMYREIIHAVDIHRKAMKLVPFNNNYINANIISEIISYGRDIYDCLFHFLIIIDIFAYVFLFNYAGQEFTDHNEHIFTTVYNVQWYVTPIHVQKLILFLLQRGNKTVSLNFGIVFVLSMELFAAVKIYYIIYVTSSTLYMYTC
ncbi:uncharacterized protein [Cardiocondyla obscurior]|uniref:uncharacterized protein n=1 Tax=Cardiocondyla obscurior TaxID=286306 RepID=UPI0039656C80